MRTECLAVMAGALVTACSSEPNRITSPPITVPYTISFPSTAAALATESIQVKAYATTESDACQSLVNQRLHKASLPAQAGETAASSPCETRALSLSLGRFALLAIAQREGEDFLIGCALQDVAEGAPPSVIALTLAQPSIKPVPGTPCTALSDRCAKGRKC